MIKLTFLYRCFLMCHRVSPYLVIQINGSLTSKDGESECSE